MDSDDEMPDVNADSKPTTSSQPSLDLPSTSTSQTIPDQPTTSQTIRVSPPSTLLLDSVVLNEICELIF